MNVHSLSMVYFNKLLAFIAAQRACSSGDEVAGNIFDLITLRPFTRLTDIFLIGPERYALDPWFFCFLAAPYSIREKIDNSM
jgi:hypothetical protein